MTASGATAPIVVGIDGSKSSIAALRYARDLAMVVDRPITVVAAWHLPAFYGGGPLAYDWDAAGDARLVLDDAVIDVYGQVDPAGVTKDIVEANPAEALIRESHDAYMVVVGSRGHGGFAGLLLGSVSAAVAEHAECPVLVVH